MPFSAIYRRLRRQEAKRPVFELYPHIGPGWDVYRHDKLVLTLRDEAERLALLDALTGVTS